MTLIDFGLIGLVSYIQLEQFLLFKIIQSQIMELK